MKLEINGNIAELKKWMADEKKLAASELKQFERKKAKELKAAKKAKQVSPDATKQYSLAERDQVEAWENIQRFCDTRHILPVAIGGVVVNGLLLERMLKKLKGLTVSYYTSDKYLRLQYESSGGEGSLELYDISDYFPEEMILEGELID